MGARTKLNTAAFNGALLIAAVVGVVFESWAIFLVTLVVLLAGSLHSGDRPGRAAARLDFPAQLRDQGTVTVHCPVVASQFRGNDRMPVVVGDELRLQTRANFRILCQNSYIEENKYLKK